MLDSAHVLVTGRFWIGADGACTIGPALTELMDKARQEVVIVAYRLTIAHAELRQALEAALARGCIVKIILDNSGTPVQAEKSYFDSLSKRYPNLTIWDFFENVSNRNVSLHAKLLIIDRRAAIVGSANFSHNGLVENHEIAMSVKGKAARSLCVAVDTLIKEGTKAGALAKRVRG